MKIKTKTSATIADLRIKAGDEGPDAYVELDILVAQADALREWGEEFATLAFATVRKAEDSVADDEEDCPAGFVFLVDALKPGKRRLVCERHQVVLGGKTLTAQPKLQAIHTLGGISPQVVATVRLPIGTEDAMWVGELAHQVGSRIGVELSPAQQALPFTRRQGEAAAEAVAEH